ncbi:MAG: hypothetical protein WCL25_00940 [bacterium]
MKKWKIDLSIPAVFILFGALTFIMTFPLYFKINTHISGFFSTDEPSVWYFWWLRYAYQHHISTAFSSLVAAPFGLDFSFVERVYPLWTALKKILAVHTNEFCSYNLEVVSGFILSGFFAYLLVRYLTKRNLIGLFSGVIFAFCPYHFARAWQHLGLAHTQWLPLYLFALFRLKEKVNKWNIVFALISLYLIFAFDLYYAYFSIILSTIFVLYFLYKEKKEGLKVSFWVAAVVLVNIALLFFAFFPILRTININSSSANAWGIVRPFEDLFTQSARPLSYFLPPSFHPLFGRITEGFVGTSLYGTSFTEHSLYLGWLPLVLALFVFKRWRRQKGEQAKGEENFYIGFFIVLALAAWLFSQPPWWNWFGLKVYMPSFFMYKLLPMFRAYCRFGIVVMLAVAVLAGFGLKYILEKLKKQKTKIAVAVLACILLLFEFWNYPPFKIIELKAPQAYSWLRNQAGDFAIAEYPIDINGPNELYKFYQTRHEKRIINGTIPGTYANAIAMKIARLSEADTAGNLSWLGVKYVLVHREGYLNTELAEDAEELSKIPNNTMLKLVKSFSPEQGLKDGSFFTQAQGQIDIYEVRAAPLEPKIKEAR